MNAKPRRSLRPYQARLITDICRSDGHVLVEQPTGSGKTMEVVTLVAMELGQRFTHAVIAAPQQQIEEGFVHLDYRLVAFSACQGAATLDVETPEHLVLGARNSKQLSSTGRLIAYLRQPGLPNHALACTHAALNCLDPGKLPESLSGIALFIDESRHALLTFCFPADYEVGQEWIVLREVRRGIEAAPGPRNGNPAVIDTKNGADEPLTPVIHAEVEMPVRK